MNSLLVKGLAAVVLDVSILAGDCGAFVLQDYAGDAALQKESAYQGQRGFTSSDLAFVGLTTFGAYYLLRKGLGRRKRNSI